VDSSRAFDLADFGGDDHYTAAVIVHPSGDEHLYLVSHKEMRLLCQNMNHGIPAHENVGYLGHYWTNRVWRDTSRRCKRRKKNGGLCENYVSEPGAACRHHRDKT
jgi:hypothetical protein